MRARHALVAFCIFVVSCGSAQFPYDYYAIDLPSYEEGELLPQNEDLPNLPLSTCDPTTAPEGEKCVVVLAEEFRQLVLEYIEMKERLKACEEREGTR